MEEENPFHYYQNTGYKNDRQKKQNLVIKDDGNAPGDMVGINFSLVLNEPLRIDKLSDIYLDSFATYDIGVDNANGKAGKHYFLLDIDEFDIRTSSHGSLLSNKIVIPNEDAVGDDVFKVHKGRKLNYVGTINPCLLSSLSGTITDQHGDSILSNTQILLGGGLSPILAVGKTIIIKAHDWSVTLTSAAALKKDAAPLQFRNDTAAHASADIVEIINCEKATCSRGFKYMISQGQGEQEIAATTSGSGVSTIVEFTGLQGASISGTVFDVSGFTLNSPHFLAEFAIIEQ